MNERIRELAEQARKHFPKTDTSGEFWVFDEEKFAELIVAECAKVIFETPVDYMEIDTMHIIRDRVREHFGVEE